MTSSNNLATIQPWISRSDSWYPDSFARETESALTKALQQSLFNNQLHQSDINHPFSVSQLDYNYNYNSNSNSNYYSTNTASASTVTASGSGSEPETPGSKRRAALGVSTPIGKQAAKRKSRASKRSMTTFIQADPANFRQMVQQVTGVKLDANKGHGQGQGHLAVVKPEPLRQPFINKLQGLLPTLDTSAYLLNYQRGPVSAATQDGISDLYSLSSFPTLESSF